MYNSSPLNENDCYGNEGDRNETNNTTDNKFPWRPESNCDILKIAKQNLMQQGDPIRDCKTSPFRKPFSKSFFSFDIHGKFQFSNGYHATGLKRSFSNVLFLFLTRFRVTQNKSLCKSDQN